MLKNEKQSWTVFHQNTTDKFLKLKNIKKEMRQYKNIKSGFGELFEKMIAYILSEYKSYGIKKYITKTESAINGGNDGVDIIFPNYNDNNIWVLQVKSGKKWSKDISSGSIKLRERANKLLGEIQDSNKTPLDIQKTWKISAALAKELKLNKSSWKNVLTFWVTSANQKQLKEMEDTEIIYPEKIIIKMAKFKAPYLSEVSKNHKFTVNAEFSNTTHKAITKGPDKNLDLLICPVKLKDFISFFEKINTEDKTIDSIFADNLRDSKGINQVSKNIINSIENNNDFFASNNGITLVAKSIKMKNAQLRFTFTLNDIDIINGQQTLRTIWNNKEQILQKKNDIFVLVKAFKRKNDEFVREITSATNTQIPISSFEIVSTYSFNRVLHKELLKEAIFFSYRTGNTDYKKQYKNLPTIGLKDLLKYATIKFVGNVWAKNSLKVIMNEIAYGPKKNSEPSVITKFISSNDDEKIAERFKEIVNVYLLGEKIKRTTLSEGGLQYSQSFDFFIYFYFQNPEKAKKFINKFNEMNHIFIENKRKSPEGIRGDNIANLYKAKKHTSKLFDDLKLEFEKFEF